MRFNLALPYVRLDRQPDFGSVEGVITLTRAAERAGFHSFGMSDHLLVPPAWEEASVDHGFEPLTTLA
jgi:alkanesulfonate monooxygenase SsuD/methylene tetrahydromethanopterin reductase-like flavin-dependent oxidoreductase (luciferase family)